MSEQEKPQAQEIIDGLHDIAQGPEDRATLDAWQQELNTERATLEAERHQRVSEGLVENAGRLVTREEIKGAAEAGQDPNLATPRH